MKKILFLSLVLLAACSEDPIDDPVQFLKPGCKPAEIIDNGSLSGSSLEKFTYENNQLVTLNSFDFEYDDGYVSRVYLNEMKYETFTYDTEDRVTDSRKYSKENQEDEFELITHYAYDYEDDLIVKTRNVLNPEETVYFRNAVTTNIDSLIVYDGNGEVKRKEFFEYDNSPNIYSNVNTPMYNFDKWIIKRTRNNISYYEQHDPNSIDFPIINYSVEINYNEFGYPDSLYIKFNPGQELIRTVVYTGCN